ncbi:MAG: hypothetical protein EBR07_00090 [Planctomycetes bacterium]|nr:hypothetical protein [Planctomycetota bacterium]
MDLPAALRFNVGFALSIALGSTFPLEWEQLLQRTASVQLTVLALHSGVSHFIIPWKQSHPFDSAKSSYEPGLVSLPSILA